MELVYDGSYLGCDCIRYAFLLPGAQSATVVIGTTKTQGLFATSDATERMTLNVLIKQLDA